MSITVTERFESRETSRGPNAQSNLYYNIVGTDDDAAAVYALQCEAPLTWDGKGVLNWTVKPVSYMRWLGTVTYGLTNFNDTGTNFFSFDTGGGTQHIVAQYPGTTITKYGANATQQKAIGWDGNSLQGCDIVVPVYQWADTYYYADSKVTTSYKQALYALTGKTNNGTWNGYAAGEVLFLGASGSKRGWYGDWEITKKFAASPNVTNQTIGDITGISKGGWQHLWLQEDVNSKGTNTPVILGVHVATVYGSGNFAGLEP